MATLAEKRQELGEKHKLLGDVLAQAGKDYDFGKVTVLGGDLSTQQKIEKVRELNEQLGELTEQCKRLELDEIADSVRAVAEERNKARETVRAPHPNGGAGRKTLGEMFIETDLYKSFKSDGIKQEVPVVFEDFELKTLFETGAGWAPESTRIGRVIEAPTRPIQVLDLIPMGDTQQAAIVYMEETTRIQAAAETAEAQQYPEDSFELTERSSPVRKIASHVPVTDEQLEDVSQVRSYLDQRLTFGLRQRLDAQVIIGNGIAPNLLGILNTPGIQTQPQGADPVFDAVFKSMTLVRVNGRAIPDAVVMHPFDWQIIRLARTSDGLYIWGHPSQPGPDTLFGLMVTQADLIPQGTALTGDFQNFCQLWDRRGVEVRVGVINNQFIHGRQTLRADVRVAFTVYRPLAFCQITGIQEAS